MILEYHAVLSHAFGERALLGIARTVKRTFDMFFDPENGDSPVFLGIARTPSYPRKVTGSSHRL
jgi:hypothetical protein